MLFLNIKYLSGCISVIFQVICPDENFSTDISPGHEIRGDIVSIAFNRIFTEVLEFPALSVTLRGRT